MCVCVCVCVCMRAYVSVRACTWIPPHAVAELLPALWPEAQCTNTAPFSLSVRMRSLNLLNCSTVYGKGPSTSRKERSSQICELYVLVVFGY